MAIYNLPVSYLSGPLKTTKDYTLTRCHLVHVLVVHDSVLVLEVIAHGEHDVVLQRQGQATTGVSAPDPCSSEGDR